MSDSDLVCVGAIMGAFGVKGEVRLKSFCANPQDIGNYSPLTDATGTTEYSLKITRPVKGGFAARVKDIRYKDQADDLRGIELYVRRDVLPNLPDDEFYYSDLIGLTVIDTGGKELGKVSAVQDHGAGDFLEINGPGLKNGVMMPFTKAGVPTVDLTSGRIIIDPPAGVFPDTKK